MSISDPISHPRHFGSGPASGVSTRTGYLVDAPASTAGITVGNLAGTVSGTIPIRSGRVDVDPGGNPIAVYAELDPSGIRTGIARRDKDLRGKHFFDTEHHPRMRYRSSSVSADGDGWTVRGVLAVRDREAPVELTVRRVGEDRFVGTGSVDRRQVGIKAPPFLIGRIVQIQLEVSLLPE